MQDNPNYYAIIPADIRYDKTLCDKAKLLYGEITSLSNLYGYCFSSNKYFAELYGITDTYVSKLIKQLIEKGYIRSEIVYKEGTKQIVNRYLTIVQYPYPTILQEGIEQKCKDNNININNTSINNKKENIKRKKFEKPTLDEIKAYIKEKQMTNVDPEYFYDHYEANGWQIGRNPMKDWKATLRNWDRNRFIKDNKKDFKKPTWLDQEIKRDEDAVVVTEEEKKYVGIID